MTRPPIRSMVKNAGAHARSRARSGFPNPAPRKSFGLSFSLFLALVTALSAVTWLHVAPATAAGERKKRAPADSSETDALKRTLRSLLGDSARGREPATDTRPFPRRPRESGRPRVLPRPDSPRHSVDVDIEKVRADTVFAAFREHLRAGRLEPARAALAATTSRARTPAEREVAEFDLIELDFFEARFDTAAAAYRAFALRHPRGYLTNDAISRLFLIDENSDSGTAPLALYATAARESRAGRPDSATAVLKQAAERYRGGSLEDDILLALGDLSSSSPAPAAALGYFQTVADMKPDSPLAPAALMRIGRYHAEVMQDIPAVIATYERVLERFPESVEADEARKLIERLRRRT